MRLHDEYAVLILSLTCLSKLKFSEKLIPRYLAFLEFGIVKLFIVRQQLSIVAFLYTVLVGLNIINTVFFWIYFYFPAVIIYI